MKRNTCLMWEKTSFVSEGHCMRCKQLQQSTELETSNEWLVAVSNTCEYCVQWWAASGGLGLKCIPRTVLVDSCYVIGATSENMFNLVACKWSWFTLITQCQYFLKSPSNSFLIMTSSDHRVVSLHSAATYCLSALLDGEHCSPSETFQQESNIPSYSVITDCKSHHGLNIPLNLNFSAKIFCKTGSLRVLKAP